MWLFIVIQLDTGDIISLVLQVLATVSIFRVYRGSFLFNRHNVLMLSGKGNDIDRKKKSMLMPRIIARLSYLCRYRYRKFISHQKVFKKKPPEVNEWLTHVEFLSRDPALVGPVQRPPAQPAEPLHHLFQVDHRVLTK